jgi:acyl carrier protein
MTVHDELEELIRTLFHDDDIVLSGDLTPADIPGWDSLAQVNLIFSIEEAFDIELTDDDLADFDTIAQLERTIECKLGS